MAAKRKGVSSRAGKKKAVKGNRAPKKKAQERPDSASESDAAKKLLILEDEHSGDADAADPYPDFPPRLPEQDPLPLPEWVKGRKVRVYADGIYDCFHFGHARALEQAKKLFGEERTTLLVGVCGDALTRSKKGQTVMNELERYESVSHCRWADEVVKDAPWVVTPEFMEKHQIDIITHGDDAQVYDGADVYEWVKSEGKFRYTRRTEGISTSDLITRIIRNHNDYIKRNFSRGFTRQQLNISFLKEAQVKTEANLEDWNRKVEGQVKQWRGEVGAHVNQLRGSLNNIENGVRHNLRKVVEDVKKTGDRVLKDVRRSVRTTGERLKGGASPGSPNAAKWKEVVAKAIDYLSDEETDGAVQA